MNIVNFKNIGKFISVLILVLILLVMSFSTAFAWKEGSAPWWYVDASYGGYHSSTPLVIEINGDSSEGQIFEVGESISITVDLHSYAAMCAGWGNEAYTDAELEVSGPSGSYSDSAEYYDFDDYECAEVNTIETLAINYSLTTAGMHTIYMYSFAEAASWKVEIDEDELAEVQLTFDVNNPPIADANGPYVVAVDQSVALDGSGSSDPDGDPLSESWVVTGDALGTIDGSTFTAGSVTGITEVTLTVDDGYGGTASDTAMVVVFDPDGGFVTGGGWIDSPAGAMSMPMDLHLSGPMGDVGWGGDYTRDLSVICDPNNTPITFEGWVEVSNLTDNGALLLGIVDKKWIDDGNYGFFSGAYAYFGRRGTNLRIGPSDGNAGGGEINQVGANVTFDPWESVTVDFTMVIYNGEIVVTYNGVDYTDTYGDVPSGLTWNEFEYGAYPGVDLWSPGGSVNYSVTVSGCAYSPIGKANFGFVSKYKKGAEVPEGNTEFLFQAGNLNFHSTHYKWLVVTGSDYAKFMGKGTINNEGINGDLYRFQIWAGDNEPDTFRIKIWYEEGEDEVVVYDNGMDQAIGGGNIVIHTKN